MALKEHGLSCPEDISIAGIDDHPMSWVLGLTTIAQPVADEAAFAASLLLDRLLRPDDAASPTNHNLPTALADRATIRRNRT